MASMFCGASAFNQPIGEWNVSGVTNMPSMFCRASAFNQPIEGWNVSGVTNMVEMFYEARAFNQSIRKWNLPNNKVHTDSMLAGTASEDSCIIC
jgi:surface protein